MKKKSVFLIHAHTYIHTHSNRSLNTMSPAFINFYIALTCLEYFFYVLKDKMNDDWKAVSST